MALPVVSKTVVLMIKRQAIYDLQRSMVPMVSWQEAERLAHEPGKQYPARWMDYLEPDVREFVFAHLRED